MFVQLHRGTSTLRALCACWLSVIACGGDSLELTADPTELAADGLGIVELSATVRFRGAAARDGEDVTFRTEGPVLFETRDEALPEVPGGLATGSNEVRTSVHGGVARAFVLAPTAPGTLDIEASVTTVNRTVLADTVILQVAAPPLIAAASNAPAALGEVDKRFGLACARANVGAFVPARPAIEIACGLTLEDAAGEAWPHTPVMLFAEAGALQEIPPTIDEPRRVVYVVPENLNVFPRDVPASAAEIAAELVEFGAGLIPGALDQNPRDGLVTLLAVVRGHEAYEDSNGNGRFDDGEAFRDEGEPFLDVDDDGVHTTADGLPCCDNDDDGVVDGPNGQWDDDVWIGRVTHVLWSGPVSTAVGRSAITTDGDLVIAQGGQESFVVRAVDANYNPIAAADDDDDLELDLDVAPSRKLDFVPPGDPTFPLGDALGLDLQDDYPYFVFGQGVPTVLGISTTGSLLQGREIGFSLADQRTDTNLGECYTWVVTATVRTTAGPGSAFDAVEAIFSASGDLNNEAGDCP